MFIHEQKLCFTKSGQQLVFFLYQYIFTHLLSSYNGRTNCVKMTHAHPFCTYRFPSEQHKLKINFTPRISTQ